MLVLSRKSNQTLHIGNDIVVTVLRVRGDTVRIGIQAPADVKIMRNELIAKISTPASGNTSTPDTESVSQPTQPVGKPLGKISALPASTSLNCELRSDAIAAGSAGLEDDDHNPDDGPMCSGPLTKFCKPQLRAVFASAT